MPYTQLLVCDLADSPKVTKRKLRYLHRNGAWGLMIESSGDEGENIFLKLRRGDTLPLLVLPPRSNTGLSRLFESGRTSFPVWQTGNIAVGSH